MTQPQRKGRLTINRRAKDGNVQKNYSSDESVKNRVEVAVDGTAAVVKSKPGQVNWKDKAKAYWHTIITVIGAILVLLNQITPITSQFGGNVQMVTNTVIVFLTAFVNFLKSNEIWVNAL